MPVKSLIKNAADPMTGGRIEPPVDAAASIAAALVLVKPVFTINGIVKEPVVTTSAVGEPDTDPYSPEDTTATFALPPTCLPTSALEIS